MTEYIIEKMDNLTREWWTGNEWSVIDTDAWWYKTEEEAKQVADKLSNGITVTGFEVGKAIEKR